MLRCIYGLHFKGGRQRKYPRGSHGNTERGRRPILTQVAEQVGIVMEPPLNHLVWNNRVPDITYSLAHLWNSSSSCDVTLVCQGGRLSCHSVLLASVSKLFKVSKKLQVSIQSRNYSLNACKLFMLLEAIARRRVLWTEDYSYSGLWSSAHAKSPESHLPWRSSGYTCEFVIHVLALLGAYSPCQKRCYWSTRYAIYFLYINILQGKRV